MTILFLDPHGTANLVVKAAKENGYSCTGVFSSDSGLAAYPEKTFDTVIRVQSMKWEGTAPQWWSTIDARAVKGIYFNTDASFSLAHRLRDLVGLPSIPSDIVDRCLNKRKMRLALSAAGLSRLKSISGEAARQLTHWPFAGAAYFKPVYGAASAYVKKLRNLDDLRSAIKDYEQRSDDDHPMVKNLLSLAGNDFHVEEAFEGELISVESMQRAGKGVCLGILSRILFSQNPIIEMGSCFPYPHPLAKKIVAFAESVHRALGFLEGPSHVEIMVGEQGDLEVIDFNPRIVGADVIHSINFAYGIKLQESLLSAACNAAQEAELNLIPKGCSCLQYVLPPAPLTIESFELPIDPNVVYTNTFVKEGQDVSSVEKQTDYLGCYLVFAEDFPKAKALSHRLRTQVRINKSYAGAF